MKRPSLALLALLASIACGLVAMSPRRSDATTLGELLCAIEVIAPPCHAASDSFCPACPYAKEIAEECPHVCTPPGMPCPLEAYEEAPAAEPAAETTDATAQVELNAADVSPEPDSESAWEDEYGDYYGDFKTDEEYANEYASEYEAPAEEATVEDAVPDTTEPTVVEEAAAESPDYADVYGANYDPWTPVVSENLNAPSPEDLLVDASNEIVVEVKTDDSVEDVVDLYGRHIGDRFYGYDYDEVPAAECEYDSAYEYEYEYESPAVDDVTPAETEESAAATTEANAESYYEEYYPDYYAELYSSEQTEGTEATETAETPAAGDDVATEEYDAAYGNAVDSEATESTEVLPAPGTVIEVPNDAIIDELVDPTTAESEADLPWADEVPAAEETAERPALESEYGSDYAEDYYRALFGEEVEESTDALEEEEFNAEPLYDETYELFMPPCRDGECLHPTIDATQIVVDYGRTIFELTDALELASMRLHSAAVMLAELPSHVEVK